MARNRGIKDVAHEAGVSVGTVSNVLNHPDRVSDATTQRVRRAMHEIGYVRNESARALRAGSSRVIGLTVLDAANPFFMDVATGVEEVADRHDRTVALLNSGDDPARERRHLEALLEMRVQGLLMSPVGSPPDILDRFLDLEIPVVFVDRHPTGVDACAVVVDDVVGGQLAGSHLVERGRERIAYLGGPPQITQVADRLAGLRQAVQGRTEDPIVVSASELSLNAGATTGAALLDRHHDVDAVFAANDLLALGVLRTLIGRGIRVPDDVAVVGYDDIAFAGGAAIPLTSVRQPREALGRAAAGLLFDELSDGPRHSHRTVEFTPELVVRESTMSPVGG